MSQDNLAEAVRIITEHLLHTNATFCGSEEGRRLQGLLRQWRRDDPPAPTPAFADAEWPSDVVVARSVNLSVEDDVALANLAERNCMTRDQLIRSAVLTLLRQQSE